MANSLRVDFFLISLHLLQPGRCFSVGAKYALTYTKHVHHLEPALFCTKDEFLTKNKILKEFPQVFKNKSSDSFELVYGLSTISLEENGGLGEIEQAK